MGSQLRRGLRGYDRADVAKAQADLKVQAAAEIAGVKEGLENLRRLSKDAQERVRSLASEASAIERVVWMKTQALRPDLLTTSVEEDRVVGGDETFLRTQAAWREMASMIGQLAEEYRMLERGEQAVRDMADGLQHVRSDLATMTKGGPL